jgi:two-component system LytT family response regulator
MRTNCIIIEDEPLAMERARYYVSKVPSLNLLSTFNNGIDALVYLKSNKVDLIFLDINLGEISGIKILETGKITCQVIIITAYQEYALKGFELNVTDYLMKPYTFERFLHSVMRAQDNLSKNVSELQKDYIFIKTEYRLEKVALDEILYIEGMRDYRRIHTFHKKIMTLQTFKELEQELPTNIISRVHKSYMVSINKIESVERDRIKIKDVLIPISETYKQSFLNLIHCKIVS